VARKAYARRYAQAVFEIALEAKELEKWQADLQIIVSLTGDADIAAFLESPRVNFEGKVGLLSDYLKEIRPLALKLVQLLITKGRIDLVSEIGEEYQRLLDSYHGIEQAEVITAVTLTGGDEKAIARHLEAVMEKNLVLKTEVDPGLLGGVVARIGGKLLDGSTRSKLDALKRELKEIAS